MEHRESGGVANQVGLALEIGGKRTFATALDWPGWCRSGRDELGAVDALLEYVPRYDRVLGRVGMRLPDEPRLTVLERLTGGGGTDFGAPGVPACDESRPTRREDGERLAAILAACWREFDEVARAAPAELRKGPRGGGRDRSKIVEHVVEAERGHYARKLGVRIRPLAPEDRAALEALRAAVLDVLRRPSDGLPLVERGWPVRFAARYMAWHVLDHAWEIEDRST